MVQSQRFSKKSSQFVGKSSGHIFYASHVLLQLAVLIWFALYVAKSFSPYSKLNFFSFFPQFELPEAHPPPTLVTFTGTLGGISIFDMQVLMHGNFEKII